VSFVELPCVLVRLVGAALSVLAYQLVLFRGGVARGDRFLRGNPAFSFLVEEVVSGRLIHKHYGGSSYVSLEVSPSEVGSQLFHNP
jgi:hypothetical protein